MFWPERAEAEVATLLWLFVAAIALAILSLALLIVLLHDLVQMTIAIEDEGLAVDRWPRPFHARWDEVREVGLVASTGDLTVRSRSGSVTVSRRLLGSTDFAALVALVGAGAPATRDWTRWQMARRQLVLVAGPALGLALLLALGQEILRRRTGRAGSRR